MRDEGIRVILDSRCATGIRVFSLSSLDSGFHRNDDVILLNAAVQDERPADL